MSFLIDKEDIYFDFIKEKMNEVNPDVYNDCEFELCKIVDHENIMYLLDGKPIAFCVIIFKPEYPQMAYSWCDGTTIGKKAYSKGIDYLIARHRMIAFGEGALRVNKVKRMIDG